MRASINSAKRALVATAIPIGDSAGFASIIAIVFAPDSIGHRGRASSLAVRFLRLLEVFRAPFPPPVDQFQEGPLQFSRFDGGGSSVSSAIIAIGLAW